MAKVVWAGTEREVNCTDAELAEVMSFDDPVILGSWLGDVEEIGHAAALAIALDEYGSDEN
jgi:hypothetical protein